MQIGKRKVDPHLVVGFVILGIVALLSCAAGGVAGYLLASDYEKLPFEKKYDALAYDEKRDVALIFLASGLHRYGAEVALCNNPFLEPVQKPKPKVKGKKL